MDCDTEEISQYLTALHYTSYMHRMNMYMALVIWVMKFGVGLTTSTASLLESRLTMLWVEICKWHRTYVYLSLLCCRWISEWFYDNDNYCATVLGGGGGWWYDNCARSVLTKSRPYWWDNHDINYVEMKVHQTLCISCNKDWSYMQDRTIWFCIAQIQGNIHCKNKTVNVTTW